MEAAFLAQDLTEAVNVSSVGVADFGVSTGPVMSASNFTDVPLALQVGSSPLSHPGSPQHPIGIPQVSVLLDPGSVRLPN